jgi:single-strand DNA-binding protein
MSNFNRIIIIGNLTRDPEHRQLASGLGVTRLGLACNRQYKNRQTGALMQEVCFIDVDVFGPQAESTRQYLQKGKPVLVEGRLKFDTWQTPDGQTRSKHSIVADRVMFLQPGPGVESEAPASADVAPATRVAEPKKASKQAASGQQDAGSEFVFKDEQPFQDDLPF